MMLPQSAPVERITLRLEYSTKVNYHINDALNAEHVMVDPALLSIPDIIDFRIFADPNSSHEIIFTITSESSIRVDKPEYASLVQEIGNPESSLDAKRYLLAKVQNHEAFIDKIVDYLAWRKKLSVNHNLPKSIQTQCYWTLNEVRRELTNNSDWYTLGELFEAEVPVISVSSHDFEDFTKFFTQEQKSAKPLYHELFVEAERLLQINQIRSSYLILYSALEVASKNLIATLAPQTKWLIDNIPSPDLVKLYREYINTFGDPLLSKEELEVVRNMGYARNSAAHSGIEPANETVHKHLDFVRRVLYRIDERSGFVWVKDEQGSAFHSI